MKTCETCGEPIADQSGICPYCETPQRPAARGGRSGEAIRTVNIEAGMPTVSEALRKLETQLDRARADGVRLLRVIHGWGSASGGGGKIRTAARCWLKQQEDDGRVRSVLFGDHYTHTSPQGRDFQRRHPILRSSQRTDRENPGITFVEP